MMIHSVMGQTGGSIVVVVRWHALAETRAGLLAPGVAPILGVRNRWLRTVLSQASCVIAPTQFVKNIYGQASISTRNIRVITHGIPKPDEAQIEQIHARKYYKKAAPPFGIYWRD